MEIFSIRYVYLDYSAVQKYTHLRSLSIDENVSWDQLLKTLKFNSRGPSAIIYNIPLLLSYRLNESDLKFSTQFFIMVNVKESKTLKIENSDTEKTRSIEIFEKVPPFFKNKFIQKWYKKNMILGILPGTLSKDFYNTISALEEPTLEQWERDLN